LAAGEEYFGENNIAGAFPLVVIINNNNNKKQQQPSLASRLAPRALQYPSIKADALIGLIF